MAQSDGSGILPPSRAQNRLKVQRHGWKEKDQSSDHVDLWQRSIWRHYRETIRSDNYGPSDRSQADMMAIRWHSCAYINERGMRWDGG